MILNLLADATAALDFSSFGLSPIALDLGTWRIGGTTLHPQVHWYSLGYIAGILFGYWYLTKLLLRPGAPMAKRHAEDLVFYATIGILAGGRLGYVLFYKPEILRRPIEVLYLWQGGMSLHGGLIGTLIAIWLLARRNRLNALRICDYVAVVTPPALGLVRIANFINGELWGRPTTLPWGIIFPRTEDGIPRHPSQLYEAALEGVLLFLVLNLLFWKTDARYKPGFLVGSGLAGYGIIRFLIEYVRQPDAGLEHLDWGLTMGQTLSVPMIAAGAWLIATAAGRRVRVEPIAGAAASPDSLPQRLAAAIAADGPMPLAGWMAAANAHYYATRDPLGVAGDFTTAPEISQMFGELTGLWLADLWQRAGRPPAAYVELGPGRGTLAVDALRAMRKAGLDPAAHFVETSPALRAAQAARIPAACWHDDVSTLPADRALLIVANEFFDALPIHQHLRTANGWHERRVTTTATGFAPTVGPSVPAPGIDAAPGAIVETRPAADAIVAGLATRIAAQGGTLLAIDYGHRGPALGDTLQAVRAHAFADPFADPGEADLTAHVDFTALARAAPGLTPSGPVDQGEWLLRLGLATRAAALARAAPDQADAIATAYRRLSAAEEMGHLFKVLALTAPSWPEPAGLRG